MATMGAVPVDSDMPYVESNSSYNTAYAISQGNNSEFTVAQFTMPWAGSAVVQTEWTWFWTHYEQVVVDAGTTSPGPSGAGSWETRSTSNGACYVVLYSNLWFANLNAGQVVTAKMRVFCGTGETGIQSDWFNGNYRLWRA